jgi:hypothetical protein
MGFLQKNLQKKVKKNRAHALTGRDGFGKLTATFSIGVFLKRLIMMKRGDTMMNKKRLTYASLIGVASVLACVVQAVDTVVPDLWDVTPYANGLKIESFNAAQPPTWASTESLVTGTARSNSRFWYADVIVGTALNFATLGITNTFSGAKIQIGTPVFIEMRCKLNPFDTTPPAMEPNTILCFYANQNSNLVVASASECKTNVSVTVNPSLYYPIMVRFAVDKFDVFFNNETETATLSLASTTNEISKMVISGAGEMDDLYVSYGNPRRATANSGIALGGGWVPDTEEEYVVANWLASKASSGTYTQANAEKFYLTDTTPTSDTFDGELGIGSFSFDPSTLKVSVVVTLKTASAKKTGKINGVLKLKGAATYADAKSGTWSGVLDAVKIGADDFTDGVATYTFTLQNADYKFFLPVIQSQIN